MNQPFDRQISELVARSPEFWAELDGKAIFLSGGTGFTGRWLLAALLEAQRRGMKLDITVLTRSIAGFRSKAPTLADARGVRLIEGDVTSFDYPPGKFTYVIHAAATSAKETFDGENPLNKFDMAAGGARRMLDLARRCEAERVLMVGSGSVYGGLTSQLGLVPETYLGAPLTLDTEAGLGHGKRAAEFFSACYSDSYGLSISVARCFAMVGAYLPFNIHYAIGNFIRDALNGKDIIVQGDGTAIRSYLFAGDLVVWLLTILLKGHRRAIYNVGSDEAIAVSDLANMVQTLLSPTGRVHILGKPSGNARSMYVPDIGLARSQLGLAAWTSLDQAIIKTAETARVETWPD